MKKNKFGFFYPILSTIACIFLCSYIWGSIKFNYSNPYEIVGEYSSNNYSVYNDTVRYLVFIFLPVLSFCLVFFTINKKNNSFNFDIKKIFLPNKKFKIQNLSIKYFLFFLFILFVFFLDDDWLVYYLDIFEQLPKWEPFPPRSIDPYRCSRWRRLLRRLSYRSLLD